MAYIVYIIINLVHIEFHRVYPIPDHGGLGETDFDPDSHVKMTESKI